MYTRRAAQTHAHETPCWTVPNNIIEAIGRFRSVSIVEACWTFGQRSWLSKRGTGTRFLWRCTVVISFRALPPPVVLLWDFRVDRRIETFLFLIYIYRVYKNYVSRLRYFSSQILLYYYKKIWELLLEVLRSVFERMVELFYFVSFNEIHM